LFGGLTNVLVFCECSEVLRARHQFVQFDFPAVVRVGHKFTPEAEFGPVGETGGDRAVTHHKRFINLAESFGPVSELGEDFDCTFLFEEVPDLRGIEVSSDIAVWFCVGADVCVCPVFVRHPVGHIWLFLCRMTTSL